MALKATIFKADLSVSDMIRDHYADHSVTIARHPSENDERMMVRLLAFCLNADDALAFGNKIGNEDEPDLWKKDATGAIELWIDVGQPDERQIRKACGRSRKVTVYTYSAAADIWWGQVRDSLGRSSNLSVYSITPGAVAALAKMAQRGMRLQCTVQEGQAWVSDDAGTVQVDLETRMRAAAD